VFADIHVSPCQEKEILLRPAREERALLGSVKSRGSQVCPSAVVPALVEPDNRADCEDVGKKRVLNHFGTPQGRPKQNGPPVLTGGPKRNLQQFWLEGQAHTKLQHSRRTQTKHTSSETGAVD